MDVPLFMFHPVVRRAIVARQQDNASYIVKCDILCVCVCVPCQSGELFNRSDTCRGRLLSASCLLDAVTTIQYLRTVLRVSWPLLVPSGHC